MQRSRRVSNVSYSHPNVHARFIEFVQVPRFTARFAAFVLTEISKPRLSCFLNQPFFFFFLICFYFQPANYSFSSNFLDFLLIYINYLKFSDYFCFITVLSFSISAFNRIGYFTLSALTSFFPISSIIRSLSTSNSIYLSVSPLRYLFYSLCLRF